MTDFVTDDLVRTIVALTEATEKLHKLAYTDALTGIPNRRCVEERTDGRGGYFVLADLDGFKLAQDGHPDGHKYGDLILMDFACFLLQITRHGGDRASDRVAGRLGGDEFVVWCPSAQGAERICNAIRQWVSEDGNVSASAGIGSTMQEADAALYLDKTQ
jgi:diguanylate cyclase (GGDEF)-like protein